MGPDQVLIINPSNSIIFEGTFKEVINKKITITNPLDKNVAFKIKTTTPKQYCVRPNIGFIAPEQTKEISIMLQPLQYTLSEKAKHKFMIQSMIISEEDVDNIDAVWKNAPANVIMCSKLLSVLIQTNEVAQIKEKHESDSHINQVVDDMVSFNDSQEHMPEEEEIVKEMLESAGDIMNGNVSKGPSEGAFCEVLEENVKLKEQVAALKNMVFENTYKWESMQTEMGDEGGRGGEGEAGAGVCAGNGVGVYEQSVMKETIGMPAIVYQLIAFFLGLIIGKFLL